MTLLAPVKFDDDTPEEQAARHADLDWLMGR
jgi:hypothetical protein